jgi:Protein of unknown function (DUF2911)
MKPILIALSAAALLAAGFAAAQSITLPPSGDNQRSSVSQHIGPVVITVEYSSPRVNRADLGDRRGKVWGKLVPYGTADLGFGTCKECPWRAGANENTTFAVNRDVTVEGQSLPAGTYGLHMIPGPEEWTIIFSKDSTSWGSFFYDAYRDALRVKAKPGKAPYNEFLTYEFTDREPDKATLALRWEELELPIRIQVLDIEDVYLGEIRKELEGSKGFDWRNWDAAATYALMHKKNPAEALAWAQNAVSGTFVGQENFNTLATLAEALEANGKTTEAVKTREHALNHVTATPIDIHGYARTLLQAGKKEEALRVWQLNAKRHGNAWPVNVGLARGYSAVGKYKEALKYARLAHDQAPDPINKKNLEAAIAKLEAGKDMNS